MPEWLRWVSVSPALQQFEEVARFVAFAGRATWSYRDWINVDLIGRRKNTIRDDA